MATYGYQRSWRTVDGWMQITGRGYETPELAEEAGDDAEYRAKQDNPEYKPWLERVWDFLFQR